MQQPKVIALSDYRKRTGEALPATEHWFVSYWRFWNDSLDRLNEYIMQVMEREMAMHDLKIEAPADQPLVVATRTFSAPRALVWKVMTQREHVARWWGVDGHRNEITDFDIRPGGKWRIISHAPNGEFIFVGEFREVKEPERFVWTFGMENMFFGKTLVETHTFVEVDGVTHYKSVSNYDTIEDRDGMVASGMEKGMRHGFAVIDDILVELARG